MSITQYTKSLILGNTIEQMNLIPFAKPYFCNLLSLSSINELFHLTYMYQVLYIACFYQQGCIFVMQCFLLFLFHIPNKTAAAILELNWLIVASLTKYAYSTPQIFSRLFSVLCHWSVTDNCCLCSNTIFISIDQKKKLTTQDTRTQLNYINFVSQ